MLRPDFILLNGDHISIVVLANVTEPIVVASLAAGGLTTLMWEPGIKG
jgi:hypothetical protein